MTLILTSDLGMLSEIGMCDLRPEIASPDAGHFTSIIVEIP
jgi:hypothetical protein